MRTPILLLAAVIVAAAAGCGRAPGEAVDHPAGPHELVLRVEHVGGLLPPAERFFKTPAMSLYGDGRVITEGPQIAIYLPPALPNLQQLTITQEGMQEVLRAARDAGLHGPDRDLPLQDTDGPEVMDAPTTVVTVVADGQRHQTSAYALGTAMPRERGERRELADLVDRLTDIHAWLGDQAADERAYDYEAMRVGVLPPGDRVEADIEPDRRPWPLAVPLSEFGEPFDQPFTRCGVVAGEDLQTLVDHAQEASAITIWQSAGAEHSLVLRPLLPDETSC